VLRTNGREDKIHKIKNQKNKLLKLQEILSEKDKSPHIKLHEFYNTYKSFKIDKTFPNYVKGFLPRFTKWAVFIELSILTAGILPTVLGIHAAYKGITKNLNYDKPLLGPSPFKKFKQVTKVTQMERPEILILQPFRDICDQYLSYLETKKSQRNFDWENVLNRLTKQLETLRSLDQNEKTKQSIKELEEKCLQGENESKEKNKNVEAKIKIINELKAQLTITPDELNIQDKKGLAQLIDGKLENFKNVYRDNFSNSNLHKEPNHFKMVAYAISYTFLTIVTLGFFALINSECRSVDKRKGSFWEKEREYFEKIVNEKINPSKNILRKGKAF
jgi:hypothetical protein